MELPGLLPSAGALSPVKARIELILALLAFVGGLAAIPFLAVSFFPPSEERLLQASVELPAGTDIDETSEELRPFESFMNGDRGVEGYQLSIGGEDSFSATGTA